ncbi:DUF1593 domain-containing protein [Planctomicrobium sp. SH664]|uniref:DUF1593 domain-containing protein n=1 Tax=Planctomicrobium sp. SH664 TaxID=3448125 RepID=UPI003F5C1BC8
MNVHCIFVGLVLLWGVSLPAAESLVPVHVDMSARPRLLVLTDIGGDPDDQQSLIRLLVHANEFEIEGLLATSAGTLNELRTQTPRVDLVQQIVEAYGQVQPNLELHAAGFPAAGELLKKIHAGQSARGRSAIGPNGDTAASRWIIACGDRIDSRPLNICVWGGQTDVGQALWRVKQDRSEAEYRLFASRLRIFDIADQDQIATWLTESFPEVFYILSNQLPDEDKRSAAFRGMYLTLDESLTSKQWITRHVQEQHGPLGALYPLKTHTLPNKNGCLKEGDTPSWFYFFSNGLSNPEHPQDGSWGGRYTLAHGNVYRDAADHRDGQTDRRFTVSRWREDFQNEFQARMDWCVKPFNQANHPPVAVLNGSTDAKPVSLQVTAGDAVTLSAEGSSDPDGDSLLAEWEVYPEAGDQMTGLQIRPAGMQVDLQFPRDAAGKTLHVLLKVRDKGTPSLTRYRRAIIHVGASATEVALP